MKYLIVVSGILVMALVALYVHNEREWTAYQSEFASSFNEVQGAVFRYYAQERTLPDNISALTLTPSTERFALSEGWQTFPCEVADNGYLPSDRADFLCLDMSAPLRAICALETEKDDGRPATGMGVSIEIKQEKLTNCLISSKKRYRYIYHLF